jgi:hypothetical protein
MKAVLPSAMFFIATIFVISAASQTKPDAQAIVARAVQVMGGDRYLQVKTQIGRGRFSNVREGSVVSSQSFIDIIDFPDKERTEFRSGGSKTIQTNSGKTGWIFDSDAESLRDQNAAQVENFQRGIRVSLDNLLRGYWKGEADLSYIGKRPATLGKRNDVIKLTYKDGFEIEFEFADDGTPAKAKYTRKAVDGSEVTEEDRYAQFIDVGGVKTPFIIDRYSNNAQNSRINYESVEFNKLIPDAVFSKPSDIKSLKKDLKI